MGWCGRRISGGGVLRSITQGGAGSGAKETVTEPLGLGLGCIWNARDGGGYVGSQAPLPW
jgi:hypothetical protein